MKKFIEGIVNSTEFLTTESLAPVGRNRSTKILSGTVDVNSYHNKAETIEMVIFVNKKKVIGVGIKGVIRDGEFVRTRPIDAPYKVLNDGFKMIEDRMEVIQREVSRENRITPTENGEVES